MTEKELYDLLVTLKLPTAYDHFEEDTVNSVSPPFIVYADDSPTTKKAEDKTWFKHNNFIVTLITEKKDVALESQLEALFDSNDIPFDREEYYISDERIYNIRYTIC